MVLERVSRSDYRRGHIFQGIPLMDAPRPHKQGNTVPLTPFNSPNSVPNISRSGTCCTTDAQAGPQWAQSPRSGRAILLAGPLVLLLIDTPRLWGSRICLTPPYLTVLTILGPMSPQKDLRRYPTRLSVWRMKWPTAITHRPTDFLLTQPAVTSGPPASIGPRP
jgi:hypothetical protein